MVVVDRQRLFAAALACLLSGPPLHAEVEIATDEETAIALVMKSGRQLVLAEATATAARLVSTASELGVPVLLLADRATREASPAAALRAGAAGLFYKDSSPEEFVAGVQAVLDGHRAVGATLLEELIGELVDGAADGTRDRAELSPAETEVMRMLATGMPVSRIAEARGVSQKTVRKHLANVYRKLHVKNRNEALLWATRTHLAAV